MRVIETPEQMIALQKECIELTHKIVTRANELFHIDLPLFKVEFALRGTTAGKAFIGRRVIQYNPTLLRENPEAFLGRTVGHEVIHHAAYAKYGNGIRPHGEEWQRMMWKMGFPNSRCHSYDTSNVPSQVGKHRRPSAGRLVVPNTGIIKPINGGKIIEFD
jgi:SprT protein